MSSVGSHGTALDYLLSGLFHFLSGELAVNQTDVCRRIFFQITNQAKALLYNFISVGTFSIIMQVIQGDISLFVIESM